MKTKLLIIALLTLSFMVGCTTSNKTGSDKTNPVSSEDTQFIVLKAYDAPKDWKVLNQKESPMSTTDWIDFQSADNQESIGYSISYPGDWTLEYSVFLDKEGKKVAELIPPIVLSQGQQPFDNWKPGYGDKLISRKEISLDGLSGQKITTKTIPDDGPVWYPHSYCIAKDNKAFMIIFYEQELDSGEEALFNQIVSTLKFQ